MSGHHLVLGTLTDFLSGKTIEDTHDERYRQKIAKILIEQKGYLKSDIEAHRMLTVSAGDHKGIVPVDFIISIDDKIGMVIKYGPGSLVTRRRPCIAISRLLVRYQIPIVVVTNGEDAEIVDGLSGNVILLGLDAILSKEELKKTMKQAGYEPILQKRIEMESRIVFAYEIDGACPCDDTVCRL